MSEQVGSVTRKKSSDFHGGIRFQSSFTIRWELEDKNFLKIDIICLDDSLKYRIMAIKTNENLTPFSNNVTFRKPWGTDLVTASELIPGVCQSTSNVPTPGCFARSKARQGDSLRHQIPAPCPHSPPPPQGIYIDRCIIFKLGIILNEFGFHTHEELWRSRRVLSSSAYGLDRSNTLLDLHNSSKDTQPHSITVKCTC